MSIGSVGRIRELHPTATYGVAVVVVLLVLRIVAVFVNVDPAAATDAAMLGPSFTHPLGTDALGRDVFLRWIEATEAFFFPGLFACAVAGLAGTASGAVVGFWSQTLAASLLRGLLSVVGAWPRLVLVVVCVAVFTASFSDPAAWAGVRLYLLAGLVGVSYLPSVAHAVGERVAFFEREQFIEAARAHGISDGRILTWHILWGNCRNLVFRQLCSVFGGFLLVETSLSYLGHYGVPAPRPSWGNMLAEVRSAVVHTRRLLIPESWSPTGVWDAVLLAIAEGGAFSVAAPTLGIVVTITGVFALAETFARRDA